MELSGWQTVLIALGGGLITGAAALLVAFVSGKQAGKQLERRLEHDRHQQWTDRRFRAGADFATGVDQAIPAVRLVIAVVREKQDVDPVAAEAHRLVHEGVARLARIRLLFGQDTAVTRPAEKLLDELELARDAAADPDPSFALAKLDEVYRLRDEFQAEAIAVMHRLPDGSSAST